MRHVAGFDLYMPNAWHVVGSRCKVHQGPGGRWNLEPGTRDERDALRAAGIQRYAAFATRTEAARAAAAVLDLAPRLQRVRQRYILVPSGLMIDCDPSLGALPWRIGDRPPRTLRASLIPLSFYDKRWRTRRELCEELAPIVFSALSARGFTTRPPRTLVETLRAVDRL